jgi:hypothetical protein
MTYLPFLTSLFLKIQRVKEVKIFQIWYTSFWDSTELSSIFGSTGNSQQTIHHRQPKPIHPKQLTAKKLEWDNSPQSPADNTPPKNHRKQFSVNNSPQKIHRKKITANDTTQTISKALNPKIKLFIFHNFW